MDLASVQGSFPSIDVLGIAVAVSGIKLVLVVVYPLIEFSTLLGAEQFNGITNSDDRYLDLVYAYVGCHVHRALDVLVRETEYHRSLEICLPIDELSSNSCGGQSLLHFVLIHRLIIFGNAICINFMY